MTKLYLITLAALTFAPLAAAQCNSSSPTPSAAQEVVLHSFTGGRDGFSSYGGLAMNPAAGTLYGITTFNSNVFALQPGSDGSWDEHKLYSFGFNCCGIQSAPILDASGNLYSTAADAGDIGAGAVFELIRSGNQWIFSNLHSFFGGSDGLYPEAGPVLDNQGNLYGTTAHGGGNTLCNGNNGCGTVYELTPSASGDWTETILYTFTGGNDGSTPYASLIFDAQGNLYGTTGLGGTYNSGVVFKLTPTSSGAWHETVLHSFTGGNDGYFPYSAVTFGPDGNLYGTTPGGGAYQSGTVYRLTPTANGAWQENVLYAFTNGEDGAYPNAGIVFDKQGNIYGTAGVGGSGLSGTVFELKKSGGSYIEHTLYSFLGGADGAFPETQLVIDQSGNLFGSTNQGGTINKQQCKSGCGVVFEIIR